MANDDPESEGFIPKLDEILTQQRTVGLEDPLNENQVIDIIRGYLMTLGFTECSVNYTGSTGIDLVSCNPKTGEAYAIECKGETSSKSDSAKFGKSFNSGKVEHSVGRAVYTTLKQLSLNLEPSPKRNPKQRVAMGFPDSRFYRKHVEAIKPVLDRLGIAVFFVARTGAVTTLTPLV